MWQKELFRKEIKQFLYIFINLFTQSLWISCDEWVLSVAQAIALVWPSNFARMGVSRAYPLLHFTHSPLAMNETIDIGSFRNIVSTLLSILDACLTVFLGGHSKSCIFVEGGLKIERKRTGGGGGTGQAYLYVCSVKKIAWSFKQQTKFFLISFLVI